MSFEFSSSVPESAGATPQSPEKSGGRKGLGLAKTVDELKENTKHNKKSQKLAAKRRILEQNVRWFFF